jgi:hypothetical protein
MTKTRTIDERPVHFELNGYGVTPHGQLGFHLRFTGMRGDVTCRRCLRYLRAEAPGRSSGGARELRRVLNPGLTPR